MRLIFAPLSLLLTLPALAGNMATGPRPAESAMVMPRIGAGSADHGAASQSRPDASIAPEAKVAILAQADALAEQKLYEDDSAQALQTLATGVGQFIEAYSSVLSGEQIMRLVRLHDQALEASRQRTAADAGGMVKALGEARAPEAVPGADGAVKQPLERSPGGSRPAASESPVDVKSAAPVLAAKEAQEPAPRKGYTAFDAGLYAGVVLIMASFGWFMVQNWMALGAFGIMGIAGAMALVFALAGKLAHKHDLPRVAGLLYADVVAMAPLFAYGLLAAFGKAPSVYHDYYTRIDLGWAFIELFTIASAAAMAFFAKAKSSMVALPAAIAAWFMSMDLARMFSGQGLGMAETAAWFSVVSGAALLGAGRLIDRITKVDYAFWINLAGLLALEGGLAALPPSMGDGRIILALAANLGLLVAGSQRFFNRAALSVFGTLGVLGFLPQLFFDDPSGSHAWLAVAGSAAILGVSRALEKLTKGGYNVWVDIAGLLTLEGGLLMLPSAGELGRVIVALLHVGLLLAGTQRFLNRRTFGVFGALGLFAYVGHLFMLFASVVAFPIAAAAFGLGIIGATSLLFVRRAELAAWVQAHFPKRQGAPGGAAAVPELKN